MKNNQMTTEELKPYDKVLVRDYESEVWDCDFFGYKLADEYKCVAGRWNYCIPYEGNEHLLGSYESPKVEKWRANIGNIYYHINRFGECVESADVRVLIDDNLYNSGNYFKTKEEAEEMANKIKELLKQ